MSKDSKKQCIRKWKASWYGSTEVWVPDIITDKRDGFYHTEAEADIAALRTKLIDVDHKLGCCEYCVKNLELHVFKVKPWWRFW